MTEADDKTDFEAMATDTLELSDDHNQIKITVCGNLEKGGTLNRYTVYVIRGQDKNGEIQAYRRFSQFYSLREVMMERWPGCFIPAVPDKKIIGKNDEMIKMNRERFLDNFVKKLASFEHLYFSQEFQYFIRSKEDNITNTIQKWSKPLSQQIIKRYQTHFGELAGKQLDSTTASKIMQFNSFLKSNQSSLNNYKDVAKKLALSRSALDKKLSILFTTTFPTYQATCLSQYVRTDPAQMIYNNPQNAKLHEHGQIVENICSKNPYWLIYDLIKMEHRDGEAFVQTLQYLKTLESKRDSMEAKSRQNQKHIQTIAEGNSSIKTIFSNNKEGVKSKLQSENQTLQRQKQNLNTLCDIVSALLAYITIDQYVLTKKKYYGRVFKALSCYQINFIQNMQDIWDSCLKLTAPFVQEQKLKVASEAQKSAQTKQKVAQQIQQNTQ